MSEQHWAVCRTFSGRVHRVRSEIERADHGTFLPTYVRAWSSEGRLSCRERVLLPGYLLFSTTPEGWGSVAAIDGVHGVLASHGRAGRVTDDEMRRLVLGHATGTWDDIDLRGLDTAPRPVRRRNRRPRPSRRARARD